MDAFFHLRPIVVTKDVPSKPPAEPTKPPAPGTQPYKVKIPSLAISKLKWLQPYVADNVNDDTPLERAIVYGRDETTAVDEKTKLEEGPYTALEGYIKLRKPDQKISSCDPDHS